MPIRAPPDQGWGVPIREANGFCRWFLATVFGDGFWQPFLVTFFVIVFGDGFLRQSFRGGGSQLGGVPSTGGGG